MINYHQVKNSHFMKEAYVLGGQLNKKKELVSKQATPKENKVTVIDCLMKYLNLRKFFKRLSGLKTFGTHTFGCVDVTGSVVLEH